MQKKLQKYFNSNRYIISISIIIIINCTTLGLDTMDEFKAYEWFFDFVDSLCFCIFCLEIILKIYAFRISFFTSKFVFWNMFDLFLILTTTLSPHNIMILRGLRAFRVLRMLTVIPSMRQVCNTLACTIPQIISIIIILLMFYYVYGVLCYELFSKSFPQYFATLGDCFFTLFCMMTFDNGNVVIKEVIHEHPYSWIVFFSFILLSSFVMMNLIIGLIINNMHEQKKKNKK